MQFFLFFFFREKSYLQRWFPQLLHLAGPATEITMDKANIYDAKIHTLVYVEY